MNLLKFFTNVIVSRNNKLVKNVKKGATHI